MARKKRLSAGERDRVVSALMSHSFDPRDEAQKRLEVAAGDALYSHMFTPAEQAQMSALPEGWLPTAYGLTIRGLDSDRHTSHTFTMSEVRRHPAKMEVPNAHKLPDALKQQLTDAYNGRLALQALRSKTQREVGAMVASHRYHEDLLAAWPEAADVIRPCLREKKAAQLPAVTHLNEVLGLPPGESAHD